MVVQGFGNVGSWAARIIGQLGAKVIAVSDANGAVHSEAGLDPVALQAFVAGGGRLPEFDGEGAEAIDPDEMLGAGLRGADPGRARRDDPPATTRTASARG